MYSIRQLSRGVIIVWIAVSYNEGTKSKLSVSNQNKIHKDDTGMLITMDFCDLFVILEGETRFFNGIARQYPQITTLKNVSEE